MSSLFPVGSVVWVKLRGFPVWPAKVVTEAEYSEKAEKFKPSPVKRPFQIPVLFFGSNNYHVVRSHDSIHAFLYKDWHDSLRNKNVYGIAPEVLAYFKTDGERFFQEIEKLNEFYEFERFKQRVQGCAKTPTKVTTPTAPTTPPPAATPTVPRASTGQRPFTKSPAKAKRRREEEDVDYVPSSDEDEDTDASNSQDSDVFSDDEKNTNDDPHGLKCHVPHCEQDVYVACHACNRLLCLEHDQADLSCESRHTKSSDKPEETLKKRYRTPDEKIKRDAIKHPLRPPGCAPKCRTKCTEKILEDTRKQIHKEYWLLSYNGRRSWLQHHMHVGEPTAQARRKAEKQVGDKRKRQQMTFLLRSDSGELVKVCRAFFLTTLGHGKTSNEILKTLYKVSKPKQSTTPKDRRGRHAPWNKADEGVLNTHIKSFNPVVHHYRRAHAPNRLYLPSDITILKMFNDYIESGGPAVKYERYRRAVAKNNISFVALGHEECETCTKAKIHRQETKHDENDETCDQCGQLRVHVAKAKEAREAYQQDSKKLWERGKVIVSADLEKVIMLPRIEGQKSCMFTPRIIAFNETFAQVGGIKNSNQKHFLVLWNETITGRNGEDVANSFWQFLVKNRDAEEIIIWMDNCVGQNKNWKLYSMFIVAVNSLTSASTITLKYFISGHTFMSADVVHRGIELEMKHKKNLYDWNDFLQMARDSNGGKISVVDPKYNEFLDWKDKANKKRIARINPRIYLKDLAQVKFLSHDTKMYVKHSHSVEEPFQEVDFIQNTWDLSVPQPYSAPRGINEQKKQKIIDNLCDLMPNNRRLFWHNLPTSKVPDMVESYVD